MSKLLAIAFSDLHQNEWAEFNEGDKRVNSSIQVVEKLVSIANSRPRKIPILFAGDWYHKYKSITNSLLDKTMPRIKRLLENGEIWAISGNHDQCEKNTLDNPSPSYVRTMSKMIDNFYCLDHGKRENKRIAVHGIPYLTGNIGFVQCVESIEVTKGKFNILMIHTDLHGAYTSTGMDLEVHGIPEDMETLFSKFDLVISGHVHKPAKLGSNIYMLGSPEQQNRGDMGIDMGYWKIYDDKVVFCKLDHPQFKTYKEGDEIDDFHHWTKIEEEVIVSEKEIESLDFDSNTSHNQLSRNYCKANNISEKKKIRALKKALNK